jgi:hypothetical protein
LPIRWRGYDEGVRAYQGEIASKKKILDRFEQKLSECENDVSRVKAYDWSGILLILNTMCNAFAPINSRHLLELESAMNGEPEGMGS